MSTNTTYPILYVICTVRNGERHFAILRNLKDARDYCNAITDVAAVVWATDDDTFDREINSYPITTPVIINDLRWSI